MELVIIAILVVALGYFVVRDYLARRKPKQFQPQFVTNYECGHCPPHTSIPQDEVHIRSKHCDPEGNEVKKGRWGRKGGEPTWGGTVTAADYCSEHCPGKCNRNCTGWRWRIKNIVHRKAA